MEQNTILKQKTISRRLKRTSSTPLYAQLEDVLKAELARFEPGNKFYTERELCRKFGVSQPVVRTALSSMVKQRYLSRIAPKGTFVENISVKPMVSKTMAIGVVSPLGRFFPHVAAVKGIHREAAKSGYRITLLDNEKCMACELPYMKKQIESLAGAVDGIVWISGIMQELPAAPDFLKDIREQVVLINMKFSDGFISTVMEDSLTSAYAITSHLLNLGYRRIGFVGADPKRMAYHVRYDGFLKAMKAADCAVDDRLVFSEMKSKGFEDGYEAVMNILRDKNRMPEAFLAVNEHAAHGVVSCLKDHGLNVPQDVAVAGFDDFSVAMEMRPPLTTVHQPYDELGVLAMQILFDQISGRKVTPGNFHTVPAPLVIRESCGYKLNKGVKLTHG